MSDENIESYYSKNREARRKYQMEYYRRNTDRIKRKRELDEVLDPEKIEAKRLYNRQYYIQNRARIYEKRALTAKKKRATTSSSADTQHNM